MRNPTALAAIASAVLLTAGCFSGSPVADPTITYSTPSPTSTVTSTTTVEPGADDPATSATAVSGERTPGDEVSAGAGAGGTGSRGYTCRPSGRCFYPDGSLVPMYLRCGIGCGEPPTSGEIQTHHGCEAGYITDPDLCAAVAGIETPGSPAPLPPRAPAPVPRAPAPAPATSPSPSSAPQSSASPSAPAASDAERSQTSATTPSAVPN